MINNDLFDSYLMNQYVKESGFNTPQDFDKAPLRVLFHFPGNMGAKVVSATHFCLYNCIKRVYPEVFVDICFEPWDWARNAYYKQHKPLVGFFSKRSWHDFDMIGLSNAISMSDYADTYRNLVRADFPLKRKQRDDKVAPFLWAGGIANDGAEAFNTIVDLCCEGLGERSIPKLIELALDKDPKLPQNREYIRRALQGKYGYYDPSIYKYEYDIVDGHVESYWKNPELGLIIPEVSLPIDKFGSVDDIKYKDTTPGGQAKISLLSSWGCSSAKGTCNFAFEENTLFRTTRGLVPIKELTDKDYIIDPSGESYRITAVYDQGVLPGYKFTLNNGIVLKCSEHHKHYNGNMELVYSEDIKVGDTNHFSFYQHGFGVPYNPDALWLAGFASADGGIYKDGTLYFCVGLNHKDYIETKQTITEKCNRLGLYGVWREQETESRLEIKKQDVSVVTKYLIKDNVTKLTELNLDSFLIWYAAFVQGDGTIDKGSGTVRVVQSSYEFISSLQQVLAYFGFYSYIHKRRHFQKKDYPRFETLTGVERFDYRLCHDGESSYALGLGFFHNLMKSKQEAYSIWYKKKNPSRRFGRGFKVRMDRFRVQDIESGLSFHCYDLTVEPNHLVTVAGCLTSSNCHEARLYGSFRERDIQDLEKGLYQAKASSMGEAFSYFSFNSNFHSKYPESLSLAFDYFDRLSILNMRIDALAASIRNDPVNNYVRLIKELGANSMSCPSEGFGERLRNHFLNKNCSREDIMLVANEAFKQKFARLKIGYIRTYYENDKDWKDGFDELFEISRMRDDSGVNAKIQATVTSLVHNYGCLAKDVLVLTKNGYKKSQDLSIGDEVWNNHDWKKVYATAITPKMKGYRITTKHGYSINVNGEHPFLTVVRHYFDKRPQDTWFRYEDGKYFDYQESECVHADQLGVGDLVKLQSNVTPMDSSESYVNINCDDYNDKIWKNKYKGKIFELDEDFAEVVGWVIGDGCLWKSDDGVSYTCTCYFSDKEFEDSSEVIYRLAEKLNLDVWFDESPTKHTKQLHLPTVLARMILSWLPDGHRAWEKQIPEVILKSPKSVQAAFLRGLFSADGHVTKTKSSGIIGFTTTSPVLNQQVKTLLLDFGVYSSTVQRPPRSSVCSSGRVIEGKRDVYETVIMGSSYDNFVNSIGFNNFKQDKAKQLQVNRVKERSWSRFGFDEIVSIEELPEQEFYGCELEEHLYVTNGFVTHNTPLYFTPRASAYAEWLKTFNSDSFYEYPYMPLVDQGIKVKLNGGKDTFVQQLMQDLPHELIEDILLKPALEAPTLSTQYVNLVKEGLERHGIDPKKQFMKFDPHKNPHQHIEVNPCQDGYDQPGFLEKNVQMCLKTPATVLKGQVTKCDGCGACQRIDAVRTEEGLDKRSHVQWMLTRELNTKYNVMDIKTAKILNAPNYQYQLLFKVNDKGFFISKEHLARRWMVQLAKYDESVVKSFRSYKGSFFTYADYPGLPSIIDGYMVCYASMKDKLPDNINELIQKANSECEAIQCVGIQEHHESGYPNYLYLYKIDLKCDSLETTEIVKSFKENPFRIYEESTSEFETFETNFWIKQVGSSILILAPGRMNPAYTLLTKMTFNKMMSKVLKHQSVLGIFSRVSDSELVNIITGKPQPVAGFDFVSKGSFNDREAKEDEFVAEGA